MRARWLLTHVLALSTSPLLAQAPQFPGSPAEPRPLPPGFNQSRVPGPSSTMPAPTLQAPALTPNERGSTPARTDVKLPQKEQILRVEGSSIIVRRQNDNWQLWAGTTLLHEFGKHQSEAEEAVRQMRELRPSEWVSIGTGRPVVEYGLTKGEAFIPTYEPKHSSNVDLKSVRAENVRGAWILRDDASILLNFGANRADAEQAAAVVQRYGFNRLGWIYELVDGVLIQKDSLFRDGVIAASIACELSNFVCGKSLGVVAGGSGMMRLAPGLVRVPDASFIRKAQFPGGRVGRDPIPDIHPDLAVEVISPGNTVEEMDEKLCDYFASGTVLVWYVEPDTRSVLVFTDPERANAKRLSVADTLDGGTVLPSFALPVAALFAELDAI